MTSIDNNMFVIKRDGRKEEISFDKIKNRITLLCKMKPEIKNIDILGLVKSVILKLKNGITTTELDIFASEYANNMSIKNYNYQNLASRILINNNHKNTLNDFVSKTKLLYEEGIITFDKKSSLLNKKYYEFVMKNKKELNSMIDYKLDYRLDYFGFKTLEKSYLLKQNIISKNNKIEKKTIERPQDLFLRVAITIHKNSIFEFDNKNILRDIKETYDKMSNGYFTHASPTLYNSGCKYEQLSSCYLIPTDEDSIEGIFDTVVNCSKISKRGAGIGLHISNIRSSKSIIKSIGEESNGITPFVQLLNYTARAVNQGKRRGSIALFLEPHHPDIMAFLEYKMNTGLPETRARDLSYGLWMSDYFMECVEKNSDWHLLDPSYCPGLNDTYGDEYKKLYLHYVNKKLYSGKVKARDIWEKIWLSQRETGYPYICYKDIINKTSNHSHIGIVRSSNLCVAPETLILTNKGHIKISELCDKNVKVWNGENFTDTIVRKTGTNKKLLKIEFTDGTSLNCTPYHKFYIQDKYIWNKDNKNILENKNVKLIEAQNLKEGMKLIKCKYPVIDGEKILKDSYTNGFFSGDGTYKNNSLNKNPCKFKNLSNKLFCKRHINYDINKINNEAKENMCKAYSYMKYPYVTLYDKKINLFNKLSYISHGTLKNNKLDVKLVTDLKEKYFVPINYSLKSKLEWFAGYCDADGCILTNKNTKTLQIACINKKFLLQVKYMLQTCGINPKIILMRNNSRHLLPNSKRQLQFYNCKKIWRLILNAYDLNILCDLGFKCNRLNVDIISKPNRSASNFIKVKNIIDEKRIDDTYCFNESERHVGIFNGIITSQCTEIMQYSDINNHSVCTLASICLPKFVKEVNNKLIFDYKELFDTIGIVVKNLNNILQNNDYPTKESENNSKFYKSLGIGIQGLHDVYLMFDYDFKCKEAQKLNKLISETMYYAALWYSNKLCKLLKESRHFDKTKYEYPYEYKGFDKSYLGGNPIFHWELYAMHTKHNIKVSDMWDWELLRNNIKKYGVMNSLLIALMPTASTSQIMGNSESFEPYTSNIYTRKTLAGDFIIINKFLAKELEKLGIYNENIIKQIMNNGGSILSIKEIPENIKNKYKTRWEISYNDLLKQAVVRQAFVDQSQSFNLYCNNLDYPTFNKMHFLGFKNSLKTGCYYMRTRSLINPQKVTIDPKQNNNDNNNNNNNNNVICDDEVCLLCTS